MLIMYTLTLLFLRHDSRGAMSYDSAMRDREGDGDVSYIMAWSYLLNGDY